MAVGNTEEEPEVGIEAVEVGSILPELVGRRMVRQLERYC